jgi:hypothetical protein
MDEFTSVLQVRQTNCIKNPSRRRQNHTLHQVRSLTFATDLDHLADAYAAMDELRVIESLCSSQ